jgi:hypothetical protein
MHRRRLSSLARAAFRVAHLCAEGDREIPSIFCSHSGEIRRTDQILHAIASSDEVSPSAFSLSIHNAIAGQYSILCDNTQPTISIAPSGNGYLSAFAEALGCLSLGAGSVMVICYEDSIPEFYEPYISSVASPTAIAMRLRRPQSTDERQYNLEFAHDVQSNADLEVPLLALIRFFVQQSQELNHAGWWLNVVQTADNHVR